MQNLDKAFAFFIIVAIIFGLVIVWVTFSLPSNIHLFTTYPPANTTYSPENSTGAFYLSVQTVPTVLNGITTATAIIIGFSGTIIGIVIHEFPKETKKDRKFRIFIMVLFPLLFIFVLTLDFWGYVWLLEGGTLFVSAITNMISGFLLAMLILIGLFIFIGFKFDEQEEESSDKTKQQPATTEKQNQGVQDANSKDDKKTVNITVNM